MRSVVAWGITGTRFVRRESSCGYVIELYYSSQETVVTDSSRRQVSLTAAANSSQETVVTDGTNSQHEQLCPPHSPSAFFRHAPPFILSLALKFDYW